MNDPILADIFFNTNTIFQRLNVDYDQHDITL